MQTALFCKHQIHSIHSTLHSLIDDNPLGNPDYGYFSESRLLRHRPTSMQQTQEELLSTAYLCVPATTHHCSTQKRRISSFRRSVPSLCCSLSGGFTHTLLSAICLFHWTGVDSPALPRDSRGGQTGQECPASIPEWTCSDIPSAP